MDIRASVVMEHFLDNSKQKWIKNL
uniref:Uncharacterized protein n=1 Tax=Rhizophora mucronata TaxID=61149 RepID=A0A2P2NC97_RHIMU